MGRYIYEHIVVQHNVSCQQVPPAGGIIVEIQDYARLPLANELVDGGCLAAEQELMVPVQINPICVAARAAGATVGVCLRDNRQLNGWKPGGHLLGRGSEQAWRVRRAARSSPCCPARTRTFSGAPAWPRSRQRIDRFSFERPMTDSQDSVFVLTTLCHLLKS